MKKVQLVFVLALVFVVGSAVFAQDAVQLPSTNPVTITWPPPVTEVWGKGDVIGTANVPNMSYYYLEYMPLSDDLTIPEDAPWIPATVAQTVPVIDDALATLDTTTVEDGLYALRLTVTTRDGQVYHDIVSPIRVDNARFAAVTARIEAQILESLGQQGATNLPEPVPSATPTPDTDPTPRVTSSAGIAVNVRRCALVDNDRCPVITSLPLADQAPVVGIDPSRGWYQINVRGVTGWVSRTVVSELGSFSNVRTVTPPEPLPPKPQPTAAPSGGVIPNGMSIQGGVARCNETFSVQINVANVTPTVQPEGSITLQDVHPGSGTITWTSYGNYPSLNPGANFVVVMPVRSALYINDQHELRAYANSRQFSLRYTLQAGSCTQPVPPTAAPQEARRNFNAGECTIVVTNPTRGADRVEGPLTVDILPDTYPATKGRIVGGALWYQILMPDDQVIVYWITTSGIRTQGDCAVR